MKTFLWALLIVQVMTFVILGAVFIARGDYRVGIGQLLLAGVQGIVYSVGIH